VTGLYIAFTQEFFDGTGPSNDSAIHAQSGSADAEAHEMIERYIEGCGVTLSLSLSLSPLLQAPPADCTAIPCIMVFT
jgi:hypothetical protein